MIAFRFGLAALLTAAAVAAQAPQDVDELLRLQRVLRAAVDKVAPAVVRVETFGGVRRTLTGDEEPADAIGEVGPAKTPPAHLQELFERIDPVELGELWRAKGLAPKTDAFEAEDLRALGDREVTRLLRKYQIGPFAPKPPEEEPKRPGGLGNLVPPGFLQAQGPTTGLILSSDGWIVVSRFALNFDPSTILISLPDGRTFSAKRFGEDTSRGIALVKIDATDLPTVELAAPSDIVVGQWAFVLGRTFAPKERPSVHMGIVSATERLFGRAVQIDASTSPANYGGAVIDVHGRVLGVAAPLSPSGRDVGVDWYDSGIGFATTLGDIGPLLERMQHGETLHRGWLGVAMDPQHLGPGAIVSDVAVGSPASQIGFLRGDTITAIDGVPVRNAFHLQILVSRALAGDVLDVTWERGGSASEVSVRLDAVPSKDRSATSRSEETFQRPWEGDPPPKDDGGR